MLTKQDLDKIEQTLINTLTNEVKDILYKTRQSMVIVEEKSDGDSATLADIQIGSLFDRELPRILPDSIVIQEESFDSKIYEKSKTANHVWIVDPIDGTKAFRELTNMEWCVGICLLENRYPILSLVYIPEKYFNGSILLSANKFREKIFNFGQDFRLLKKTNKSTKYISHTHRDTERNEIEKLISDLFMINDSIKAFDGHSTLVQFIAVILENNVFSRRDANIWDIIQSGYLIEKFGGCVYYRNGESIFPINFEKLIFKDNHLIMPFTIASSKENKTKVLNKIEML